MPKPLCPVAGRPLLDWALDRLGTVTASMAVNMHHGRAAIQGHLDHDRRASSIHRSIEIDQPLGTAGALGEMRNWIDGRPTLVVNADAWCPGSLAPLMDDWQGDTIRILVPGGGAFGPDCLIGAALMPWAAVRDLSSRPSGLYEVVWRDAAERGEIETVAHQGAFVDCGNPAAYLAANLAATDGASAVDPAAIVRGQVHRSVVWAGAEVAAGESLVSAIRYAGRRTVLVRPPR